MYLNYFASRLFLLGILISTAIGNKQWLFFNINVGRYFLWISIFCAFYLFIKYTNNKGWALLLVLLTISSKGISILIPSVNYLYFILVGIIYAYCFLLFYFKKFNIMTNVLFSFAILNIIFMVLQLIDAGDWVYFFSTFGDLNNGTENLIFKTVSDLYYINDIQVRPAGILSSPIYQTLFTLLLYTIHFPSKESKIHVKSIIISLLVVLSMSKMVFIAFIICGLPVYHFSQGKRSKTYILTFIYIILFLIIYYLLFPGVFKSRLSIDMLAWSFFIRFNNMLYAYYGSLDIMPGFLKSFTEGTVVEYWGDKNEVGLSGLAVFAKYKEIALGVLCITIYSVIKIIKYYSKYKIIISRYNNDLLLLSIISFFMVIMFLGLHPSFFDPLLWFIIGLCFSPIFFIHSMKIKNVQLFEEL